MSKSSGSGFRVQGLVFRAEGLRFWVYGLELGYIVYGSGFRDEGSGMGQGLGLREGLRMIQHEFIRS